MKTALFVCTGNTCRSPMAAAIFESFSLPFRVKSAGLFADGSGYCDKSVDVLSEIGIDISGGNSRQLCLEDINADIIFCMSESHRQALISIGAQPEKITVLDVSDPFGGDINIYRQCRDELLDKLAAYDIKIRPFKFDDSGAVAEIEKQCFSHPWSENALLESFDAGVLFLVAENKNGIIGYSGLQRIAGEGYVTNIAVLPKFRGFGVGTRLTKALADYCEENSYSFITLEVRKSNAVAINIYKKLGFAEVGLRRNFYDDPKEDAVIMTRMINNENTGN